MDLELKYYDKICIIGYSGSGKSYLTKHLIAKLKLNMLIVDTTSQFSDKKPIRYTGNVPCLSKRKNIRCMKIQNEADLERITKTINDNENLPIFLVVDEIDQFTDTYSLMPETSLFFQQGRNYNHGGIFTIRQVGRLNKQILSNSHYLFLFKIFNKNDIAYIETIIGMPIKDLLLELDLHEFYIVDLWQTAILGKYKVEKGKPVKVNAAQRY